MRSISRRPFRDRPPFGALSQKRLRRKDGRTPKTSFCGDFASRLVLRQEKHEGKGVTRTTLPLM
jgi:hypothetical protein